MGTAQNFFLEAIEERVKNKVFTWKFVPAQCVTNAGRFAGGGKAWLGRWKSSIMIPPYGIAVCRRKCVWITF
jgi:hypothetical protein